MKKHHNQSLKCKDKETSGRKRHLPYKGKKSIYLFTYFIWGLNLRSCASQASNLPPESHFQPFLLFRLSIFKDKFSCFCPSCLYCDPPVYSLPFNLDHRLMLPCAAYQLKLGLVKVLPGLALNLNSPNFHLPGIIGASQGTSQEKYFKCYYQTHRGHEGVAQYFSSDIFLEKNCSSGKNILQE